MKCFSCKKTITHSIRKFVKAKNKREKSKFRDLCDSCYNKSMEDDDYLLINNIWIPSIK
jgi:hypothetical protein